MTTRPLLPRGKDGKIIIGPLPDEAAETPFATLLAESGRLFDETADTPDAGEPPADAGTPPGASWPAVQELWRRYGAGLLALALVCLAAWTFLAPTAPAPPAAPTAPAATTAAAAPTAVSTLARAVVAYDAPDGAPVGALEPGRPYTVAQERGGWRQLDAQGAGLVWVRSWEMDGVPPPASTPVPTLAPAPPPAPRPAAPVQVVPIGPAVTCVPVVDGDNNDAYLGEACGTTPEERKARALELLQAVGP